MQIDLERARQLGQTERARGRFLAFAGPLLFGLYSIYLGADANWDLRNYHFYVPYAFLGERVGLDLAPAGLQSYMTPTLDLVFYGLTTSLPGMVAGFLMGALHGLCFPLLLALAPLVLPPLPLP